MTRELLKVGIVCVLITFLAACGGKDLTEGQDLNEQVMHGEFKDAPDWVRTGGSNYEGGAASVGSAAIGKAGMQFAKSEALSQARSELARQIQVKVKDLVKNFTQQIGVKDGQTVDKVAVQVSKQVTKQSISGSRQINSWISKNSNLYVLAAIDQEILANNIKDSVRTSYKNERALWQKFQAQKGFEELDEEIKKEFGDYTSE